MLHRIAWSKLLRGRVQCLCEWSGAEEPLKGQSIPVDYAAVEIITPYTEVHYDVIATDSNPNFDDE